MESSMDKTKKGLGLIIGIVFAVMLVLNFLTPLAADDFSFYFSCDTRQRIKSFSELISSLSYMRQYANGRVFAHFFAQIFLIMPKAVFNVINAANASLLTYILYKYIKTGDSRKDMLLLPGMLGLLWITLPAFGQIFLWLTGSCNYSWTISFSLIFIYPFFSEYMKKPQENTTGHKSKAAVIITGILMYIEAFVAGAYSENGAASMLTAAFCLLVLICIRDRKIPGVLTARFAVACGGFLFLMLTPSELGGKRGNPAESTFVKNFAKIGDVLPGVSVWIAAIVILAALAFLIWAFICRRKLACMICMGADIVSVTALSLLFMPDGAGQAAGFTGSVKLLLSDVKISLLLLFGLYIFCLMLAIYKEISLKRILASLCFFAAAAASLAVFVFAIYFPARSACPASFYTAIGSFLLLGGMKSENNKSLKYCSVVITLLFSLSFALGVSDIVSTRVQEQERQKYYTEQKEKGETDIVVEKIEPGSKYSAVWPREYRNFSWDMASVYGFDHIWIEGVEDSNK